MVSHLVWWRWLPLPWRKWRVILRVDQADKIPRWLPKAGAVIVGDDQVEKWIAFNCPCNQGHRVMLNLSHGRPPAWTILTKEPLTLIPSVDDIGSTRRCHYFVTNGQTKWV